MQRRCFPTLVVAALLAGGALAGEAPAPWRWRFDPDRPHRYAYTFTEHTASWSALDPHLPGPENEDASRGQGTIVVSGRADRGTLVLHHELLTASILGRQATTAELDARRADITAALAPDGALQMPTNNAAAAGMPSFVDTLFPLPREALPAGESRLQRLSLRLPGLRPLSGTGTFTHRATTMVDGQEQVRYHVTTRLVSPPPQEGDPRTQAEFRAEVDCVFLPAAGRFLSSDSAAEIRVLTPTRIWSRLNVETSVRSVK